MTHPCELELCCLDLEDTLQKMTHPLTLNNTLQKMTHPCELEQKMTHPLSYNFVALTLKILYKRWPIPVS